MSLSGANLTSLPVSKLAIGLTRPSYFTQWPSKSSHVFYQKKKKSQAMSCFRNGAWLQTSPWGIFTSNSYLTWWKDWPEPNFYLYIGPIQTGCISIKASARPGPCTTQTSIYMWLGQHESSHVRPPIDHIISAIRLEGGQSFVTSSGWDRSHV